VASSLAIEPRDPFSDRVIAEFSLRLPEAQVGGQGWHKLILRRAMVGLLPEATQWRMGKEHLGGHFIAAKLRHWQGWAESLYHSGLEAKHYLRVGALQNYGQGSMEMVMSAKDIELLCLVIWLSNERQH
jgi:asparagine synthase (glutamine-hydrolysing)